MLSPHPEKWGDASPRPPPIDARDNMYIIYEKHMGPIIRGVRYILLVKLFVTELLACTNKPSTEAAMHVDEVYKSAKRDGDDETQRGLQVAKITGIFAV